MDHIRTGNYTLEPAEIFAFWKYELAYDTSLQLAINWKSFCQ
jgi:hypothetical protein